MEIRKRFRYKDSLICSLKDAKRHLGYDFNFHNFHITIYVISFHVSVILFDNEVCVIVNKTMDLKNLLTANAHLPDILIKFMDSKAHTLVNH